MSAIGDTLLTLPVACALRRAWPDAYLAWVVEEKSSPFVANHPALDETIVLPRGWFTSPARVWWLRQTLRSRQFDIAIDCQSISKSALACWLSGAKQRIGCRGQYGAELSPWLNNRLVPTQTTHLTDRSLELLAPLGIHQPAVEWHPPVDEQAIAAMGDYISAAGLEAGYAVLNPGATWDSKLWEMDRFAAVARHMRARHGLPSLVVWGGERERGWAEQIVAQSDGAATLATSTSLHELAALLIGARLLVSSDTGPLHLSVAVGTPVVGLYGSTRPADCGPYGPPHIALQRQYEAGSRRHRRRADNHAMRQITIDDVCQACDELLAADGHYRHAAA
jgi:lipopolysaccharide heptosyltransferase I